MPAAAVGVVDCEHGHVAAVGPALVLCQLAHDGADALLTVESLRGLGEINASEEVKRMRVRVCVCEWGLPCVKTGHEGDVVGGGPQTWRRAGCCAVAEGGNTRAHTLLLQ